jgi:hypothetical protein
VKKNGNLTDNKACLLGNNKPHKDTFSADATNKSFTQQFVD